MKMFNASFDVVLVRFYIMMALVILPFFIGMPFFALLAVPAFFMALTGVTFTHEKKSLENKVDRKFTNPRLIQSKKQAA